MDCQIALPPDLTLRLADFLCLEWLLRRMPRLG
jgi:hypothetical protein